MIRGIERLLLEKKIKRPGLVKLEKRHLRRDIRVYKMLK